MILFVLEGKINKDIEIGDRMAKKRRRRLKKSAKFGLIIILSILLVFLVFVLLQTKPKGNPSDNDIPNGDNTQIQDDISYDKYVYDGLKISDAANYAGVYMEDGSGDIVSNVMMIIVENTSEADLQYAEITLSSADAKAYNFTVSNLPAGAKAVLLEQNRQSFPAGVELNASADHVVYFSEPMSLCDDRIKISGMDGALNIQNISNEAISGDVVVYYKYSSSDLYYGGITFRVRVEGGLDAGEIRQVMTGHYSLTGSTITMVTCGE